jgi:hypothetical protein
MCQRLNHGFERNWPMKKIVATIPKIYITVKINCMFHFFVINPRVHDIYNDKLVVLHH